MDWVSVRCLTGAKSLQKRSQNTEEATESLVLCSCQEAKREEEKDSVYLRSTRKLAQKFILLNLVSFLVSGITLQNAST